MIQTRMGNLRLAIAAGWILIATGAFSIPASPSPAALLTVTGMNPMPGSVLESDPGAVTIELSHAVDPTTVSAETCQLVRPGPDGVFGTADDIVIRPASVSVVGTNRIRLDLTGAPLANDLYRLKVSATALSIPGLAAYWRFDEGQGTVAADSSGNGLNGVVSGATWTAGELGFGLNFATGTDNVSIGAPDRAVPWTATMWVNRQASPDVSAILVNGTTSALKLEQYPSTGLVGFTQYGVADYAFGYSAPVGIWTHLAFVGTASGTSLYVNGGFNATISSSISCPMNLIGNNAGDALRGVLDEVRIYSRDLSAAEIQKVAAFQGAVADTTGSLLDGEFDGTFPSGNGVPGGNFIARFSVSVTPPAAPRATGMTPEPGSVLTAPPLSVRVPFDKSLDPATLSGATCRLVRAGPDGILGTADDVLIVPNALVLVNGNTVKIDLTGVTLPNDLYQLTLSGPVLGTSGLVAHWKFDEGTGSTAGDSSGNGYHGVLSGPLWSSPGRIGPFALSFNGGITKVGVGAPSLSPPWTAAMWVQRQDSFNPDARLMDSEGFPVGCSLRAEQYPNTRQVGITRYGVADYTFNYTAPAGVWTHLAFVGTATQTALYANGLLVDTMPLAFEVPLFNLGSQGDHALLGLLDDVRVYDRTLSASELQLLGNYPVALAGTNAEVIDGEFKGTFPSGNGVAGGDFVATFRINAH
jgi:hypothetical protein